MRRHTRLLRSRPCRIDGVERVTDRHLQSACTAGSLGVGDVAVRPSLTHTSQRQHRQGASRSVGRRSSHSAAPRPEARGRVPFCVVIKCARPRDTAARPPPGVSDVTRHSSVRGWAGHITMAVRESFRGGARARGESGGETQSRTASSGVSVSITITISLFPSLARAGGAAVGADAGL